jgi:hypothetical protein
MRQSGSNDALLPGDRLLSGLRSVHQRGLQNVKCNEPPFVAFLTLSRSDARATKPNGSLHPRTAFSRLCRVLRALIPGAARERLRGMSTGRNTVLLTLDEPLIWVHSLWRKGEIRT